MLLDLGEVVEVVAGPIRIVGQIGIESWIHQRLVVWANTARRQFFYATRLGTNQQESIFVQSGGNSSRAILFNNDSAVNGVAGQSAKGFQNGFRTLGCKCGA